MDNMENEFDNTNNNQEAANEISQSNNAVNENSITAATPPPLPKPDLIKAPDFSTDIPANSFVGATQDYLQTDKRNYVIPVSSGLRFGTMIIDSILLRGVSFIFGLTLPFLLSSEYLYNEESTSAFADLFSFVSILTIILSYIAKFLYFFILENNKGITIGKLITNTRVVHESGRRATTKEIFIRTLCRLIPFDAFSYLSDGVGWHDTISHTRVISKENYEQIMTLEAVDN